MFCYGRFSYDRGAILIRPFRPGNSLFPFWNKSLKVISVWVFLTIYFPCVLGTSRPSIVEKSKSNSILNVSFT